MKITEAEKKVRRAMRALTKAVKELHEEEGIPFPNYWSACFIGHEHAPDYYNVFSDKDSSGNRVDYTWYKEKK